MRIDKSTEKYEAWLGERMLLIAPDLNRKHELMREAPFPFMRATFYRWVPLWRNTCADLWEAPRVLAVGDLHVENYGTWRDEEGRLIWGINDLDEAARMPYALDLVRLATSALLAAREKKLRISPAQAAYPRMGLTLGLGLLFSPISVAAYKYTPAHLRGAAVGIASLLRTEGGSVGTSMASTIETRREQFHLSRLGEWLGPLNHRVHTFLEQARTFFLQKTGDPARSQQLGLQQLDDLRQQQAMSLAYFDVFWLCAVVSLAMMVLVLFMKRSVAEPGEHIGAE